MSGKTGQRVKTVLFMALATVISVSVVSGVYLSTRDRVNRNQELYRQRAILRAAQITVPEDDVEAAALFAKCARKLSVAKGEPPYYGVTDPETGVPKATVFPSHAPGLWGRISGVVGFSTDSRTLTGLEFTYQNETPGLGGKIAEPQFKSQFNGKRGPFALRGTGKSSEAEVDGVTGATISTKAALRLVNSAVERAAALRKLLDLRHRQLFDGVRPAPKGSKR